ncbi:MAG: cytochrome C oxidase subunit IV family protein [Actinomycetota bacterium]|nr:cytochrome C oxidase subunit IV family protein [Actinomycetota bacterium]
MSDVEAAQPTTPATPDAPDPAVRSTLARRSRERHPSPQEYVRIALILGAITGAEVGVWYMDSLRSILIPLLFTLAAIKFTLVVMWFMHLKFDNRLYARFFLSGILFALSVYAIVLLTFRVFAN